jgi:hypothetical protein
MARREKPIANQPIVKVVSQPAFEVVDAWTRWISLLHRATNFRGMSECLLRLGAAGRPQSAGSAGQSLAQTRPLAADPGPDAADHCNDRNEQDPQKHRVFDQSGAILVFAQAADESQSI